MGKCNDYQKHATRETLMVVASRVHPSGWKCWGFSGAVTVPENVI